jgi:hypothetical protein
LLQTLDVCSELCDFDAQAHTLPAQNAILCISLFEEGPEPIAAFFEVHHPAPLGRVVLRRDIDPAFADVGIKLPDLFAELVLVDHGPLPDIGTHQAFGFSQRSMNPRIEDMIMPRGRKAKSGIVGGVEAGS